MYQFEFRFMGVSASIRPEDAPRAPGEEVICKVMLDDSEAAIARTHVGRIILGVAFSAAFSGDEDLVAGLASSSDLSERLRVMTRNIASLARRTRRKLGRPRAIA